jgi:heptaprenylglyceryl phosphate synthase
MTEGMTDLTKILILNPTNKDLCEHLDKCTKTLKDSIIVGGSREAKIRLIDDIKTLAKEIRERLLCENGDDK